MLVRVVDKKAIVRIENLRKYAFEQQGWRKVTEGRVGPKAYSCSCHAPCGYRAFPGVKKIRDLQWSDMMKCWRRALVSQGVFAGAKDSIEAWETEINALKIQNRKFRDAGLVTKATPVMLLARIPGILIRALAHDFVNEFSPTIGARSEDINRHLEKTMSDLYINFEHGKPMGACLPKGCEGVVLWREIGPTDPIRVLLLTDKADHASSDLRGFAPLSVLEEARLVVVGIHSISEVIDEKNPEAVNPENPDSKVRRFAQDIALADVILVVQTGATAWGKFITTWQEMGKVVVMDIDDDIRYVSPMSPVYATRGTKEVRMRIKTQDGEKVVDLWKDGQKVAPELGEESPIFNMAQNKMWQEVWANGLAKADAITTTTPRFAETIRKEINPNAYALPNCLDLSLWSPGRHPGRTGFRVCWYGGDSHRMDVGNAAEGLGRFLVGRPDVTFVLIGANLSEWLAEVPPQQLEFYHWESYDAHSWRLMALGVDLFLAPVIKHQFNDAKSPLKWTEAGALGVPSICSDAPPYSDFVKHGVDGWLCDGTVEGWEAALVRAYTRDAERKRIGEAARKRMEADFDIYKTAPQWLRVYRELLDAKRAKTLVEA